MSIYGPKSEAGPRPAPRQAARSVMSTPLHWSGWLFAIVVGLALGIYFIVEEERSSQRAELERAGAIRLDLERAETIRRDAGRTGQAPRESADILFTVPDPPKLDKPEPLQSADIIR
jgi:hypothetical protein